MIQRVNKINNRKQISGYVPVDTHDKIMQLVAKEGISISLLLNRLIERELESAKIQNEETDRED